MTADPFDRMTVVEGDITRQDVDAVVNAANERLAGGGGVDGAIHRAAGPGLREEESRLNGCPTGEARLTGGHDLPATWIVHAVGPACHYGTRGEDEQLGAAYRNSLTVAAEAGARSIAFPALSTGAYGFPAERAARIAVDTVAAFLRADDRIREVRFVCFGSESREAHEAALGGA